jgi:2',3'-cyclic-nucleotide 2'-phosphodiesterase/3'-nucleotidase
MKKLITAVLLALPVCASALTIDVYHTSDVHGWYTARPAKWDKQNSTRTVGGFPALSALVKADKNPHILLDSGDTFQGTPEGNLTRGMATVTLMNQLGYSAADVGNHDYDYGEANLRAMVAASSFTWVGGNAYLKANGERLDYLKPYTIVNVAGKRIAVIGILGRHTATSTLPEHVKHIDFRSEPAEAAKLTEEVSKLNPDAIIILAHIGLGDGLGGQKVDVSTWTFTDEQAAYGTLAVARAAKGANVVLGGHNHTGLLKGYYDKQSGVLLGESYWMLTDVTRVSMDFDDATGKFKGAAAELVPLWTDTTGEDQAAKDAIKTFTASVDKEMSQVIGMTDVDLLTSTDTPDSPIGNWGSDAIRRQTGADAVIQNTAGLRSVIRKGQITMRDVYQVMPFENTLVKLTLTGEQLGRLFADNLHGGRSALQVSGITVSMTTSPQGAKQITVMHDGKVVGPADKIAVVTNNYLAFGGTGGKVFSEASDVKDTMQPIREVLIKDIKENPVKALPEGGRIKISKE